MYCMYHVMSSIMYSHRIIVWYMYPWLPMQNYLWLPISTRLDMAKYIIYWSHEIMNILKVGMLFFGMLLLLMLLLLLLLLLWSLVWITMGFLFFLGVVLIRRTTDKETTWWRFNTQMRRAMELDDLPIYMKGEKWPHFHKGKWGESQILTARHICRIVQIETTSCFGKYWTVSFVFDMDERFLLLFVNVLPFLEYQTQASCSTTSSSMEQVGKPNPIMPPWYANCIIIWTLKKTKKWCEDFLGLDISWGMTYANLADETNGPSGLPGPQVDITIPFGAFGAWPNLVKKRFGVNGMMESTHPQDPCNTWILWTWKLPHFTK